MRSNFSSGVRVDMAAAVCVSVQIDGFKEEKKERFLGSLRASVKIQKRLFVQHGCPWVRAT